MKASYEVAEKIDRVLMIIIRYVALVLLIVNAYIIIDTFYIEKKAFSSYDLKKYKPVESADEGFSISSFDDLMKLNKDAVGWLTVYDTNIDYPIVQGRDNFEYANKDVFGKASLTGSIYLDAGDKGFEDFYSLIHGHHMENGAMFGGIDEYVSKDYLHEHNDGFLQTPEGNYRLTIFACVSADAYDDIVYDYTDSPENREELSKYLMDNSICSEGDYLSGNLENVNKLIVMSTCDSAGTFDRLLLLADAHPGTGRVEKEDETPLLTALGHISNSDQWAVLNLICTISIIFLVIDSIRKKHTLSTIIQLVMLIISAVLFIFTENISADAVLFDGLTPVMLLILTAALIVEIVFLKKNERNQKKQGAEEKPQRTEKE